MFNWLIAMPFFLVPDLSLSYFTDVDDEDLNNDPGKFI